MMNRKQLLLAMLLQLIAIVSRAHNGSITGQVIEKSTGLELAGAVVKLQPANLYTTSNNLGIFTYQNLPAGEYSLIVSYLGYGSDTLEHVVVRDAETTTIRVELAPSAIQLKDVEVTTAPDRPFQNFSALDIRVRPINTTQDMMRMVPGLFIAQHAGGGKAEQMFLRGFDIDHGTDVNVSVDGMPVNMPSHAHGQGYADLHFVIPELVENIEFKKGPYAADAGDFATAGVVRFHITDAIDRNMIKLEGGSFNTARAMAAFNLLGKQAERQNRHAYLASEAFYSDGYFDKPQGFQRLNLLGKYSALFDDNQRISFTASAFQSDWDASGQVPDRAVASGLISRFGSIDPSEGGKTSRYNLNFEHLKSLDNNGVIRNQLYYSDYAFELYSDFTFFLNDPVNGDEIRQKEHRRLFGYNGAYTLPGNFLDKKLNSEIGWFLRNDAVNNDELTRVKQRRINTAPLALGDVNETNTGAYVSETWQPASNFSVNAAVRYDLFRFSYTNKLDSVYNRRQLIAGAFSPKLNLNLDITSALRLYLSAGYGFHSNDARVVVPQDGHETLPQARGADLGAILKPAHNLLFNVAAWYLALDQEFVYVGDEAVVEAGGRTQRYGLDLSARFQFLKHLFVDADITYSHARSIDDPEGENLIPLAPKWTATGGLSWENTQGFFGSLRFRHLGDRPANEDGSLTAQGYFLLDAVGGWRFKNFDLNFAAQNLLNVDWKEAQFDTESRLKFESEPVSEIHFTPGTPFFLKGGVTFRF